MDRRLVAYRGGVYRSTGAGTKFDLRVGIRSDHVRGASISRCSPRLPVYALVRQALRRCIRQRTRSFTNDSNGQSVWCG